MKIIILILAQICCYLLTYSQNIKLYIGDTIHVSINHKDDSSIIIKNAQPNTCYEVYYDSNLEKIALLKRYDEDKDVIDTIYTWYSDGTVKSIYFSNPYSTTGINTGTTYYNNGAIKKYVYDKNDTNFTTIYYQNGCVNIYEEFSITPVHYYYKSRYCDNGQMISKSYSIRDKIQKAEVFHCNGQICADYFLFNGLCVKEYKEYYENGSKKIIGSYLDLSVGKNGYKETKIGVWKYFNEKGKLIKKEKYK